MRTRIYILPYLLYIALHIILFINYIQLSYTSYLNSYTIILRKALHKALYKALYIEALHKALYKALRIEALHKALYKTLYTKALHQVPAIFPITSIYTSAKYIPYIATLIFTFSSFLISSLPREVLERQLVKDHRQNQTTVTRTR